MPEKQHFSIDCHDVVHVVRFSPFEFTSSLLAVGTATRVVIVKCTVLDEKSPTMIPEFKTLKEFNHGSRVTDICWSPNTDLMAVPRTLRFFTAGGDNKVRCYSSDMKDSTVEAIIGEHRDYVNSIACQFDASELVASTGDDNVCSVWSGSSSVPRALMTFTLTSPGVVVRWHPVETGKIMVAEQKGVIRFYSVITEQAIQSIDCGHAPLVSADWCLANSLGVAALAGTDWFVFDTSRSSHPLESRPTHSEGGRSIRWCSSHDHLLATTGRPGAQIKVFNIKSNQVVLSINMKISNGLCWHRSLPLVAVGGDRHVELWVVDTV